MATENDEHTRKTSEQQFFVTRESQQSQDSDARKLSYVGMRDLSDIATIEERDIVGPDGAIRGIKNRVRAGLVNFENPKALEKKADEEGKVVVYTTSFRGVRSTFEECRYVLSVLHNYRVKVDERDVYRHKFYFHELEERLQIVKGKASVPHVFMHGQHIGGGEQIEQLNESGELRRLLAEFPHLETANNCEMCNGYKFVPCRNCGGSKNSISNDFTAAFRALRCTHCNENGLEPCPECLERERKAQQEEEEEEELSSESGESDLEGEYEVTEGVAEDETEEEEQVKRVRRGERRRSEAAHWAELRMKENIGRRKEEEFEDMVKAMATKVLEEALKNYLDIGQSQKTDTEEYSESNDESTH